MASFVSALSVLLLGSSHMFVATSAVPAARGRRPCAAHVSKTVDVGGPRGWTLGLFATWQQPPIYVGDRLRFAWPAGRNALEHNVYVMPSKQVFDRCQFNSRFELSDTNYTTPPFKAAATYYYGCEEPTHCLLGQKVAIVVQKVPNGSCSPPGVKPPPPGAKLLPPGAKVPPPPPPAGSQVVFVGSAPYFWSLYMASWRQPVVRTGDKLVFLWNRNSIGAPHDLRRFAGKQTYEKCNFTGSKLLARLARTRRYVYVVKEKRGSVIYFGCSYKSHCQKDMKVKVVIS